MKRETIIKNNQESINRSYSEFEPYLDIDYKLFFDLRSTVWEITNCIMLEFDKAAITLTNNLLERLLKLSLIYNDVGIDPIPFNQWNNVFSETDSKYGSIKLGNSIELCKKHNLITQEEKNYLFHSIRELMRNGFSHADASKILKEYPDEMVGFQGSLSNPSSINRLNLNQKTIPPLQGVQIENFAKSNAKSYFLYVVELLKKIEYRLISK